jgi:hypothetical protein
LYISPDNAGSPSEIGYRTWFYFSVTNVKSAGVYMFCVRNMNFQIKIFREGLVPVYKALPSSPVWRRIPMGVHYMDQNDKGFEFEFGHKFDTRDERVFFAFCFPWSYEDNNVSTPSSFR